MRQVARVLIGQGWSRCEWRQIDGGTDYYTEPVNVPAPIVPLREVAPEPEPDRAKGWTSLADAMALFRQGYSGARVTAVTGWGAWWFTKLAGPDGYYNNETGEGNG